MIAGVRFKSAFGDNFEELDRERLIFRQIRHQPRFSGVGNIPVGQQHDRRHILNRNTDSFYRTIEAINGRARGNDRHWRIPVAAIDGLIQVGLLRLRRQARRRSAALAVDDDKRKFGHDGKAHRLTL